MGLSLAIKRETMRIKMVMGPVIWRSWERERKWWERFEI